MAIVGEILDLVEEYTGKAGVDRSSISKDLLLKVLNNKLAEMHEDTGWQGDNLTITTLANVVEYAIPNSGVPLVPDDIIKVLIDGERASLLSFNDLESLKKRGGSTT